MRIFRTFKTASHALRRNVMRAILTTLGIIIGIAAVIAMMEIGTGSSSASIEQTIASMGANTLLVFPGSASSSGVSFGAGTGMTLTPQDCDAVLRECPEVRDAAPVVRVRTQIVYGHRNWAPNWINGTTPAFSGHSRLEQSRRGVCVHRCRRAKCQQGVHRRADPRPRAVFNNQSPIGEEVRVQNVTFKVVGVLSAERRQHDGPWTRTTSCLPHGRPSSSASREQARRLPTRVPPARPLPPSIRSIALYPSVPRNRLFDTPSAAQQADTPLPGAVH